ncbi:MAG: hypothetical protein HQK63_13790 [Desulfamplus sp.]|nr:hypothetical protein [Desulfamplus sp.]
MNTLSTKNINSHVNELKHLTLSIDRGITNEISQKIIKITDSLGQHWQQDKILSTLVKMTRALSDYAASGKININRDLSSLLHSIVVQMEYLSSSSGANLPIAKKQAILSEQIAKYNNLKQQIKSTTREQSQEALQDSNLSDKPDMNINIISELKSIILSLDWEITDELINKLEKEVNRLQPHWQNSKTHLSFLQMFKSIGSYVMSKGSNTHPDSISLLHSLYKNFEQIVLNPSLTVVDQKEILLKEMKKFNDLKQIISSSKISNPRSDLNAPVVTAPPAIKSNPIPQPRYSPPVGGMSPMDDLIGTKNSSNLSPVDDLIEEIHMLQDSGDRTHSIDNRGSHGSAGGGSTNSEIKEVIPNRFKKQPIPEIQTRLDAFFDEDESLSELSFADSGETVVPYKGDSTTSAHAALSNAKSESNFDYGSELDMQAISFEDDSVGDIAEEPIRKMEAAAAGTPKAQQPIDNFNIASDDSMIPYELDSELFEEEIESVDRVEERKTEQIEIVADVVDTKYIETPEAIELLEELKSAVGKSMFHGGVKEIKDINEKISALEILWSGQPQKLLLLKMVKSLSGYFDLLAPAPEEQTLELMLYIVESMEDGGEQVQTSKTTNIKIKTDNKSKDINIIDVFSRYIDFQNSILINQPKPSLSIKQDSNSNSSKALYNQESNGVETLADKEILYDRQTEDNSDIEKQLTQPKGLWGKIKNWFGF